MSRAQWTLRIIGCWLRARGVRGSRSPSCRWKARSGWPPPIFYGARDCSPGLGLVRAMSEVSPARRVAFAILKTIEKSNGHSDDLLRSRQVEALSQSDRNLTTALVLGVLRWQIDLDQRIRPLLKHPNAKLDAEVLIALAAWGISVAAHGSNSGARCDRRKCRNREDGWPSICFRHGERGTSQTCCVPRGSERRSAGRGRLAARISRMDGRALERELR